MATLHRPLLFAALDKYVSMVITLATAAIAARLLTPDEIGVFVVGGAVVMLADALREFGTGSYIVQRRELERGAVRTAFTAMLLLALLIGAALILAAGPIAGFYRDPRLIPVLQLAAFGTLVSAFAGPCIALLRRDMAFGRLAVIDIGGLIANLAAMLLFVALGAGYLSLSLAALVAAVTVAFGAVFYRPQFWIFRPNLNQWREIFSFGGLASATAVLNNLYSALPQILLGRLAGFDSAGIYSRAATLCQLPDRAIVGAFQPVIFSAFAAEIRAGGTLKASYLYALTLLSSVQWPVLVVLVLLAEPVVQLILGPQWGATAPVLRILALGYMAMMPASLTYPTLVAVGRVKDTLTSSLIGLPIGIAAMAAAAPFGLTALAVSVGLSWPLQVAVSLVLIRRQLHFAWLDLGRAVWRSLPVTLGAAVVPGVVVARAGLRADLPLPLLALALGGAGLGWLLGLSVARHPLLEELRHALALIRRRPAEGLMAAER
jgi:O-antigen/teichoic acid export membrane protein